MAAKSAINPLRYATPGQLVICLLMFFLPWIEIQCPMPDMKMAMDPKKGPPDIKSMPYVSFLSQSGLQAATGEYTFTDPMIQKQMESAKAMAGDLEKSLDKSGKSTKTEKKDGPDGAPLLWIHLLAVIAGIGVGFAMALNFRPDSQRKATLVGFLGGGLGALILSTRPQTQKMVLVGCCAVALLTAGGQALIGFPITKKMKEDSGKDGGMMGGMGDMGGGKAGGPKLNPDEVFKTVYKFPFFLSLFFAVGALATAAITPNKEGGSKKPLYDMDDDDDDDRPRKRRRDEDDDEEEERPKARRKSRDDDDEDEEERPAKKRRRDDDDDEEEERPKSRRKPSRDDDDDDDPPPRRDDKGKGGKPSGGDGGNPFNFG